MIEVKNLTKSFGDKTVLRGINARFETGKTNLIIGQSGSGKTVLMKNLVGLLHPTSGEVLYDGRDFVGMTKREQVMMRREMGMIFQGAAPILTRPTVMAGPTTTLPTSPTGTASSTWNASPTLSTNSSRPARPCSSPLTTAATGASPLWLFPLIRLPRA